MFEEESKRRQILVTTLNKDSGLSIRVFMFEYVRLVTGTFSETRSPGMGESGDWWS